MFEFDGIEDVEDTLTDMMERSPSLVGLMEARPGQKESRWFHKLAPPPTLEELQDGSAVYVPAPDQRLNQLDTVLSEFKDLKEEVEALRYQVRELSDNYESFVRNSNKVKLFQVPLFRALFYNRVAPLSKPERKS